MTAGGSREPRQTELMNKPSRRRSCRALRTAGRCADFAAWHTGVLTAALVAYLRPCPTRGFSKCRRWADGSWSISSSCRFAAALGCQIRGFGIKPAYRCSKSRAATARLAGRRRTVWRASLCARRADSGQIHSLLLTDASGWWCCRCSCNTGDDDGGGLDAFDAFEATRSWPSVIRDYFNDPGTSTRWPRASNVLKQESIRPT